MIQQLYLIIKLANIPALGWLLSFLFNIFFVNERCKKRIKYFDIFFAILFTHQRIKMLSKSKHFIVLGFSF